MNKLNGFSDKQSSIDHTGTVFADVTRQISSISLTDCILTIKMYWLSEMNYSPNYPHKKNESTTEYQINLKEIEAIEISLNKKSGANIKFKTLNESKLIGYKEIVLQPEIKTIEERDSSGSIYAPYNEQIVKAFNHLRKLCGAPEPLKF